MCSPPIVDAYRPMCVASWEEVGRLAARQHARRAAVEHCSGAALLAAPVAVGVPTLLGTLGPIRCH